MKLSEQVAGLEDEKDRLWEVTENLFERLVDALYSLDRSLHHEDELWSAINARNVKVTREKLGFLD